MVEKISIIVPVYNVEKYLKRCIDSILEQTYKNLEIILVDDGSTDSSPKICDKYAEKDNRIKVVHKENGGVSDARNVGLENSSGDLIGFVDPDDYIKKGMFEYLYSGMKKYGADVSVCGVTDEYGEESLKGIPSSTFYVQEAEVLDKNKAVEGVLEDKKIVSHLWDKLYKRELWEGIYFPVGKRFEDMYVMHEVLARAEKVVLLPEEKYIYVRRSDSISFTKMNINMIHTFGAYLERLKFAEEFFSESVDVVLTQTCISAVNIYNTNLRRGGFEAESIAKVEDFLKSYKGQIKRCNMVAKKFKLMTTLIVHVKRLYPTIYKTIVKIKGE